MKKFVKTIAAVALIALTVVTLVSCGFSSAGDPDKDKEKLSILGYTGIDVEQYTEAQEDGLIAELFAKKSYRQNIEDIPKLKTINIYYYDTETNAKTAYGGAQDRLEDLKLLTPNANYDLKLQGKVIIFTIK